jgi:hypothetical protein
MGSWWVWSTAGSSAWSVKDSFEEVNRAHRHRAHRRLTTAIRRLNRILQANTDASHFSDARYRSVIAAGENTGGVNHASCLPPQARGDRVNDMTRSARRILTRSQNDGHGVPRRAILQVRPHGQCDRPREAPKYFLSGPRRPPRVLRVKCFLAGYPIVPAAAIVTGLP